MEAEFDRIINGGLLSGKRRLLITRDFIYYQKKKLSFRSRDGFGRNDISGFSFGIKWISFVVIYGRKYVISIQDENGGKIHITFTRYFGIGTKAANKLYNDIVIFLNEEFFSPVADNLLNDFDDGKPVTLGRVTMHPEGICIKNGAKETHLLWDDVRTQNYITDFTIYSAKAPVTKNFSFSYETDWNTTVLYSVVRTILQQKNIETY